MVSTPGFAIYREVLQQPVSPLALNSGRWYVTKRKDLWQNLSTSIFDVHLDNLKQCAVTVLSEHNPQLELQSQQRYDAVLHRKVLKYSPALREGLTESLALLGTLSSGMINCTVHKPSDTAALAVREILGDADRALWGSLNNFLPILAEASPSDFLQAVENALQQTPCPFDEFFAQESGGIFIGGNYLAGLFLALETLAWDKDFLVRVCVILGHLADRDTGGNCTNRSANSLTTILLPCFPQTIAPIEKREVALKTIMQETPAVAWKLLLSLLPDQFRISGGTRKPSWRNTVPDDWNSGVSQEEYRKQTSFYAELAVEMAGNDTDKIRELIGQNNLPQPAFDQILEHLSSEAVSGKPENQRTELWAELTKLTRYYYRQLPDAKRALNNKIISRIEDVAAGLVPQNPSNLHRILFSGIDSDIYEENGNLEEQQRKLEEKRHQAIKDILAYGGTDAIVQFAENVESPFYVGHSLGVVAEAKIDERILPSFLETDNNKLAEFTRSYIWSRQYVKGWEWVDGLDRSAWSVLQVSRFLSYLPFTEETWKRVAAWLGQSEGEYWTKASIRPYSGHCNKMLRIAVDKLIGNGRAKAAIHCLGMMLHNKKPLDKMQSIKALLDAASSTHSFDSMEEYYISEIIKALQDDPEMDPEDLFKIEWEYLPVMTPSRMDVSPKMLENRLASDPVFFCKVIRYIYLSKKEAKFGDEPGEQEQTIVHNARDNAWVLLNKWRTPPGTQPDRTFSPDQFTKWLEQVKEGCTKSRHLEVALTHIGRVLVHSSSGSNELWIHPTIADALNDRNAGEMRHGYATGVLNSRCVYWVDPTGEPEKELAEQYRQKAESVENAGHSRFAATLKGMAAFYDRDAERITVEYEE